MPAAYCNAEMFQKYFGIRAEWVDMTEIVRRITLGIYDHDEFDKALSWVKANCKEGFDCNAGKDLPEIIRKSKVVDPDKDWAFITKMTIIMRDIFVRQSQAGRNGLARGGSGQERHCRRLPGAAQLDRLAAQCATLPRPLWLPPLTGTAQRPPTPFATENDTLNGVAMMLGTLVSGTAPCFHDVRTYWSPEACQRVTGMAARPAWQQMALST